MFFRRLGLPLVLVFLFAGVGFARAPDRVVYYFDWFPGPQFIGLFAAQQQGFFKEENLQVETVPFAFGQNAAKIISDADSATCALGTIEGYIFLQRRAAGFDLKAMAATLQESPAGFMSLKKSGIGSARDFAGHRIGVHKFTEAIYRWFLQQANVRESDATMVLVQNDVGQLIRGEVDAMQGFAVEEFVQIQNETKGQGRFLSFAELGFSSYSQVFFTTQPMIDHHADELKRFFSAVRRGWVWSFSHPAEAARLLRTRCPELEPQIASASLQALKAYVCPGDQLPLARMDEEKWALIENRAQKIGLINHPEPVESFLRVDIVDEKGRR